MKDEAAMSKKTLSLGLAQETLTKFNSFANTGERGKVSAGGEFGCVLALYDGKFQISEIAQTGPAALSGLVAVGDELVAVDGKCLRESGARLQELTAGEEGFPVWLELKPRSKSSLESPSRTVRLIRQSPLDAKGWALSDVSSNISSSASSINRIASLSQVIVLINQSDTRASSMRRTAALIHYYHEYSFIIIIIIIQIYNYSVIPGRARCGGRRP